MAKAATGIRESGAEQSLSWLRQVAIVVCASAVIALCSRVVLPLPFTPIPMTLGSKRGFSAAALYLVWGVMGLPVFSPSGPGGIAQLLGPTGGYLWAYPVMAFVAGWIAEKGVRSFAHNLIGGMLAEFVLFAGGIAWLAVLTHSWQHAAAFGLYPFLAAEVMKVMIAAALARRLQRSL